MHGVKRQEYLEEKEERLEEEAKKSHYSNLLSQMLKDDSDTESALRVTKELLLMNPEHYHAWNKRKQSLLISDSTLSSVIIDELEFSVETLKLNPKSYPSWYHRRWLLSKVQQEITKAIAPNELRLCSKLLQLDARNFHCWNYRAFLCDEILHVEPEQELKYTGELITKNFSNYSAWHRRAVVTLRMELNVLKEDLEMIKSAIFTDPSDECAWFYLRFLFKDYLTESECTGLLDCLKELYAEEPDCELLLTCIKELSENLSKVA